MIWQAVRAGFDYFQREAGYTRTGSHNTRVHGRETGQWHEADLVVAHWLQHTSGDGDMQLHVHSQIAHVARTVTRAGGRSVYQRHGGVRFAAHAQLTMEDRMLALARASGAPCLAARVEKFDACASRASSRWDGARPYCCSNRAARARTSV